MLPLDEKEIASFNISSYSVKEYSIIFTRFTWIDNDLSIIYEILRKYFSHKFYNLCVTNRAIYFLSIIIFKSYIYNKESHEYKGINICMDLFA